MSTVFSARKTGKSKRTDQPAIRRANRKAAILPVLHLAQEHFGGWLSTETMDYVAELLHILPVEVYEVATFYSMYNLKPVGKYVFEVCQTGPV